MTLYQKSNIKKEIANLEEEMVLGVKRGRILLMSRKKQILYTVEYKKIKEMGVYATSLVFVVEGVKAELRVDTIQSFEISKLIEKYSKDIVTNQKA